MHAVGRQLHSSILVNPDDLADMAKAEAFNDRLVERAENGRHLHRRARHRDRQDRLPRARARRSGRPDAPHQADAGPGEPDEPGEDI